MALWMLGIGPSSSGRAASTLNLLSTTQSLHPCKDDSYMHVFVTMCQREKCLCKWCVQTSYEVRLASAPTPANSGNAYFPTGYFNDFPCHWLSSGSGHLLVISTPFWVATYIVCPYFLLVAFPFQLMKSGGHP